MSHPLLIWLPNQQSVRNISAEPPQRRPAHRDYYLKPIITRPGQLPESASLNTLASVKTHGLKNSAHDGIFASQRLGPQEVCSKVYRGERADAYGRKFQGRFEAHCFSAPFRSVEQPDNSSFQRITWPDKIGFGVRTEYNPQTWDSPRVV